MSDKFLKNGPFSLAKPDANATGTSKAANGSPAPNASDMWKEEKKPWAASMGGRLAIRSVSRGVLGSAFYAAGTHLAMTEMATYDPENPKGPVQQIAHLFDVAVGKPIEKIFGKDAVTFRPTLQTGARTLGQDVVDGTLNFAMATAGDALGRNIVGMFDPNVESKWRGEDGKVSFPKAVKSVAFATGRIFEAQMEDWFVAVPYAYQKRAQRNIISHFSPGFEYDADRGLNGSSFKTDEHGNITGTYTLEGAIDLQGRFTGYNIGTMIYRDGMKIIKGKMHDMFSTEDKKLNLQIPTSPVNVLTSSAKSVGDVFRYGVKSAIKATLILTPSVPVFWTMRNAQSKDRSIASGPDGVPLLDMDGKNIRYHRDNASSTQAQLGDGTVVDNPFAAADFDPYGKTYGMMDTFVNPFGKLSYNLSRKADGLATDVADRLGKDPANARALSELYVQGSLAYTPYIYTKNEFAARWDNKQMDTAIYRAIDGLFGLKFGEIKEGVRDIHDALKQETSKKADGDKGADEEKAPGFVARLKGGKSERAEGGKSWSSRVQAQQEANAEMGAAPRV